MILKIGRAPYEPKPNRLPVMVKKVNFDPQYGLTNLNYGEVTRVTPHGSGSPGLAYVVWYKAVGDDEFVVDAESWERLSDLVRA